MKSDIGERLPGLVLPLCDDSDAQSAAGVVGDYYLVSGRGGPRWFIPGKPGLALSVLEQWRPYSLRSRLLWQLMLLVYRTGLLGVMRNVRKMSVTERCMPAENGEALVPVVYIGTPSAARKLVIFLVRQATGRPVMVRKVAIGDMAPCAILNEARVLQRLEKEGIGSVPRILGVSADGGNSLQTMLEGSPSGRALDMAHINWLLSLPVRERSTVGDELEKIRVDYSRSRLVSGALRQRVEELADRYRSDHVIELVQVHGDFVPWNIRTTPDGNLHVVDWESACTGVPMFDLYHFHFMQSYLFSEDADILEYAKSAPVREYCSKRMVDEACLHAMVLVYVARGILNAHESGDAAYADYLGQIIERMG